MEIKEAKYIISSPSVDKCPKPDKPEYAFLGRSNVGKSSLINMLCNKRELAKVSANPGKTQMINHFEISSGKSAKWYLVDLPGYGFAQTSGQNRRRWEQMIETYFKKRENLLMVFVLIDARHSPQKIDIEFLSRLKKWDTPFSLVFTKADKATQSIVSKNVKSFLEEMRKTWQFLPQHFVTSAVKKLGKEKILELIEEISVEAGSRT